MGQGSQLCGHELDGAVKAMAADEELRVVVSDTEAGSFSRADFVAVPVGSQLSAQAQRMATNNFFSLAEPHKSQFAARWNSSGSGGFLFAFYNAKSVGSWYTSGSSPTQMMVRVFISPAHRDAQYWSMLQSKADDENWQVQPFPDAQGNLATVANLVTNFRSWQSAMTGFSLDRVDVHREEWKQWYVSSPGEVTEILRKQS